MANKTISWTKCRNVNSKRYKKDLARHLDGKALKCVTERVDGIEEVIGKSGAIIQKDDELLVYSSQDVIFRTKIVDLAASELLSLEGVVIECPDIEHGGEVRKIVAYYSYWRQLED